MAITVYACRELYLLLILNLIQMKKFLLLSLFLSALYVRAAVVPVSGTETIADAVSSAVAGDIIELSEAVTYVGNVTIDKSLTLRAAEGLESAPIIQGKLSIKDGATIRGIVFDGASEVADAIRIDDTVTELRWLYPVVRYVIIPIVLSMFRCPVK